MSAKVACPKCGRQQPARGPNAIYWCEKCQMQHDDDPDEGGSHSDHNPAARLEREERRRENQSNRKRR